MISQLARCLNRPLYGGATYTTLEVPVAQNTWAYGISANNIVGHYEDANGMHGFVATPVISKR